jgi:hypothetical protein
MRVYLDTSIFPTDFGLRNSDLRALLTGSEQLSAQVVLPAVVVEELVAHYREALEADWAAVQAGASGLNRNLKFAGLNWDVPSLDIAASTTSFREHLRQQLADLRVEIAPFPAVPHQAFIERDLARRLPFRKIFKEAADGKQRRSLGTVGYRDALIWETVLADARLASPDVRIVLVTTNTSDFADGDDTLHPHLVHDLEEHALQPDRVRLYTSFRRFSEQLVTPYLTAVNELLAALEAGQVPLVEWLTSGTPRLEGAGALDLEALGIKGYRAVAIEQVLGVRDLTFRTPRRLDDGFYFEGTATFDLQLVLHVDIQTFAELSGLDFAGQEATAAVEARYRATITAEFSATLAADQVPQGVTLTRVLHLDPASPLGQLQRVASGDEPLVEQLGRLWRLAEAGALSQKDIRRLQDAVARADYTALTAAHVPPSLIAPRIIEDLVSHNWYTQNPAIQALRGLGIEGVAGLPATVQEELGRNVLQAADGGAHRATGLLNELRAFAPAWPRAFVQGVLVETLVNSDGKFRLKADELPSPIAIAANHPDAAAIFARVGDELREAVPKSGPNSAASDVAEARRVLAEASEVESRKQRRFAGQLLAALDEASRRWLDDGLIHEYAGDEEGEDDEVTRRLFGLP